MRKLLALLLVFSLAVSTANIAYAQEDTTATEEMTSDSASTEEAAAPMEEAANEVAIAADETEQLSGFQVLKKYFIDGDWRFMSFVLVCLILGLAFCIERIITLNIATTNTDKLLARIDDELKSGNIEGAKEVCKSTPGPTASILYEGLKNADQGPEAVEKAIIAYGGVQMGLLERGLVWISLFIAIAPMLGFMGTVIGMIQAFDRIQAVGDLSPSVVAGGIKVALLTTVFGLISAIILQIFYNYIVNKIDGIVAKMEDASIAIVDVMAENNVFGK
ncbi:MAG: MotA/TolQ/ExbB proton channel family protein [Saprospiraceae bacterium]